MRQDGATDLTLSPQSVMESGSANIGEHQKPELGKDYPIRVEIIPQSKSPYEKIAQHVPLFISVLALALSIWSSMESRRHNMLSVRPSVRFFREGNGGAKEVGLFIENNGLGPALIDNMRVYLDGKLIQNIDDISDSTRENYKQTTPGWNFSHFKTPIKTGDRFGMFFTSPKNIVSIETFRDLIFKRLFVIGNACSFYDECSHFCSTADDEQCDMEEKKFSKANDMPLSSVLIDRRVAVGAPL